jgi:hypothetical protein
MKLATRTVDLLKATNTNLAADTIKLFKVVVADKTSVVLDNARNGFITDFVPTRDQLKALQDTFKDLPIVSLFSVRERENAPMSALITKQLLHYIEVYGLGMPGLFDLEVSDGKITTLAIVRAVTAGELTALVHGLIYSNKPVADSAPIVEVIRGYNIPYDINKVQNNEVRVALFDVKRDVFTSGDDAVRYICFVATGKTMLIKSKSIIKAVTEKPVAAAFLQAHTVPLAKVFNRHKRIIMACKASDKSAVNKISKLSKTLHVPIIESRAKHLVSDAVKTGSIDIDVLRAVPLRAKFNYLNLIEWKLQGQSYDVFLIRNGKVWFEDERAVLNPTALRNLRDVVLGSIGDDLQALKNKAILLDANVDYGLPISRKQTFGNLPFGTRVTSADKTRFCAGVYWHNNFGDGSSIDLDLSAIDENGSRTGWGQTSGYARSAIVFSGDMTDARNGATEFMTVHPASPNRYGLMVNVFRGPDPCDCEIVVGNGTEKTWLDNTLIRERVTLKSKMSVIGFLKDDKFVVYAGRLSNSRVSGGKHPIIDKGLGALWTVSDVLDGIGVSYDVTPKPGVTYDHDLRYTSFSLDKLETMFK